MTRQAYGKHKTAALALTAALTMVALASSFPVSSAAQSLPCARNVYSLSKNQTQSRFLGIYGVPACATIGGERYRGVYISYIFDAARAHNAHLKVGDVLLNINGRVVETPGDADRILSSEEGNNARLHIARQRGNYLEVGASNMAIPEEASLSTRSNTLSGAGGTSTGTPTYSINELEDFMFQLVNNDRAMNGGVPPLRRSSVLDKLARKHAEDMAKRHFFGHVNPDGKNPYDRLVAAGVQAQIAENVAWSQGKPDRRTEVKSCEEDMMGEDPHDPHNHRANILHPQRKCIGIGVAVDGRGKLFAVQEFSNDDIP